MSKIVDSLIAKVISKKTMEQYERIRQTGLTNMYDHNGVIRTAMFLKCKELANITYSNYKILLLNFQKLMKHYDIKQPKLKEVNTTNEQKIISNTTCNTVVKSLKII